MELSPIERATVDRAKARWNAESEVGELYTIIDNLVSHKAISAAPQAPSPGLTEEEREQLTNIRAIYRSGEAHSVSLFASLRKAIAIIDRLAAPLPSPPSQCTAPKENE